MNPRSANKVNLAYTALVLGGILFSIISGCSGVPGSSSTYAYPTQKKIRVRELCAAVYAPPLSEYIAPSRKRKLRTIRPDSGGFVAVFSDERSYWVPLESGLPHGEIHYCNFRPEPTPCLSSEDWDTRCEWDRSVHPDRFSF